MARKIVLIRVKKGCRYAESVKEGREFTSVSCMGTTYGSAHPCDNDNDVRSAIESCKMMVREMGDIPKLEDNRVTLDQFL